jgi:hypothetical protein
LFVVKKLACEECPPVLSLRQAVAHAATHQFDANADGLISA